MACCGTPVSPDVKFEKGGGNDISEGPLKKRRCTDIICLLLIIGNLIAYFIVTFAYAAQGNIAKLWQPRDYSGAYCGVAQNWNNGPNLESFGYQTWMMNVSMSSAVIMQQLMCSSAVAAVLTSGSNPIITDPVQVDQYLCACCHQPCGTCTRSLSLGGDLTSYAAVSSTITGRMGELTSGSGASLFNPAGFNSGFFTNIWNQATQYFIASCATGCALSSGLLNSTSSRSYTYAPPADSPLQYAWKALLSSSSTPTAIQSAMQNSFTFQAYPSSACPYPAMYCVPFPGLTPKVVTGGYCDFTVSGSVVSSVGSAAANAFNGIGTSSIASSAEQYFGQWVGEFTQTIDTFCVVSVVAFAIGLLFLVILRFTVGFCVYFALFSGLLLFIFVGALCFIRSSQCAGVGFGAAANQQAVALTVTASNSVTNAYTGEASNENLVGDGFSYIGVQQYTINGHTCQAWGTSSPQAQAARYNTTSYPNSSLSGNYCRNPYKSADRNKAPTIWCFTTDTTTVWEECTPIGVIQPGCAYGYAVSSSSMRMALRVIAIIIWTIGIIYFIGILCLMSRIRLAIALNKVAAMFVAHNPLVLLVPIIESILACVWVGAWAASAGFLLSQVPPNYMPTTAFTSYSAVVGTDTSPGACNSMWPAGTAYKDEYGCSGQNVTAAAACWKCYPPRYTFDVRFCYSLFAFLWNNEFILALGQMILAGAVGVWFFTPNREKGRTFVIRDSLKHAFRYHLGTLAFGALIIATVKLIRYICFYFEQQAKAQKNRVMVLVLRVLQCCLWCFEKCLKFLNKNAYIQTALLGTPFCTSAKNAFYLIARNIVRFGVVTFLSNIVHFIGYFAITASSSVAGYFILQAMHPNTSPVIPVVVYVFMSYLVAGLYMNVFGMAVDTSLQCVIAAEEMDCSTEDFVPGPLTSILPHK